MSPDEGDEREDSPGVPSDETVPAVGPDGQALPHPSDAELLGRLRLANRFRPGSVVARRFVIVRFLGSGGMGEVYEAEDRFLQGSHIALKAILPISAALPGALSRFEREVLMARQIIHPNVCPVYDIVHAEDTPDSPFFISMKLLSGETLSARLQRVGKTGSEEAVCILRQISSALRAAHRAGVIHRDLKPGNIMLEGSGEDVKAVVTDFGLAREYEPDETAVSGGYVMGTPGYMAPEVLKGQPATPASDLYALGVLLHKMLTGQRPLTNVNTGQATISPELSHMEVPRFSVPLIKACLDTDPSVRYRGFEEALKLLDPEGSSHGRSVYPTSRSWTRRRMLGFGAAAACAVGGGMYWEWNRFDDQVHPLPQKRFVALMAWPPETNAEAKPVVSGVIDAMETALSRAEETDRDLFVISSDDVNTGVAAPTRLTELRDSLGANLVLATSGIAGAGQFRLLLSILDVSTNKILRERHVSCALSQLASLNAKAINAAARLLNVSLEGKAQQAPLYTQSLDAYRAFQTAEGLFKEPNENGLAASIQKYKDAVAIDPRYALAYARLAFAYSRLYDLERDPAVLELSRANGEKALSLDNDLVDAHVAHSAVFELEGDPKAALEEISQALRIDPDNPKTLMRKADIFDRMNRWSDAEQTYRRILKARPNYWPAYNDLGAVLTSQGRYRKAIESFQKATVAFPKCAMAFSNLGEVYLREGELNQASVSLQKSLELKENYFTCVNISKLLRFQGRYAEAVTKALRATEINSLDDQNWLELGDGYLSLPTKKKEACDAYRRADAELEHLLQTDPRDGPAWMRRAWYRTKCGGDADAPSLLAKADRFGAIDLGSQLVKVRVLEALGKRKEALETLAAARRKGMTKFEIEYIPDLQALRKDSEYSYARP